MRLESVSRRGAEVVLSERNLLTLLSKVRREDSARTLVKREMRGRILVVRVEPDEAHYARGYGPGRVHDDDEPGAY